MNAMILSRPKTMMVMTMMKMIAPKTALSRKEIVFFLMKKKILKRRLFTEDDQVFM